MNPALNDTTAASPTSGPAIPPLEPGDRLTRDEFERRYAAMPNLKKAELIEGVVYMPSPVRYYRHGQPHADLITWLGMYRFGSQGVNSGDNTTARLDLDNEPQPDAMLFIAPAHGGQVTVTDDDYIEGAPELVAEVASSSVSFDLNTKFNVYRRCGVKEYIVWRVLDQAIDWFTLSAGTYQSLSADGGGILRSQVFPGLWLDAAAMLRSDLTRVSAVLQSGLASADHAQFIQKLTGTV